MNGQHLISRKNFISTTIMGLTATAVPASAIDLFSRKTSQVKAIAFDAFPIFDPRPVFALADSLFQEKGKELSNTWRTTQFEYCWLRSIGGKYRDFRQVTEDSLVFAAKKTGVLLTNENREALLEQYLTLTVWPDVIPALQTLQQNGIRLSFLSNFTADMLHACMKHAKIDAYFEHVISTDRIKTYKPDPKAYQLGVETFKLKKEDILFTAFAGWDASGAKWFGYPTFWMNRQMAPSEELQATPDGMGRAMTDLIKFLEL